MGGLIHFGLVPCSLKSPCLGKMRSSGGYRGKSPLPHSALMESRMVSPEPTASLLPEHLNFQLLGPGSCCAWARPSGEDGERGMGKWAHLGSPQGTVLAGTPSWVWAGSSLGFRWRPCSPLGGLLEIVPGGTMWVLGRVGSHLAYAPASSPGLVHVGPVLGSSSVGRGVLVGRRCGLFLAMPF